jgi:hypothetical protein
MGVSLLLCVTIPPQDGKNGASQWNASESDSPSPNLVFKIPRIANLPGRFACQDLANTFGW